MFEAISALLLALLLVIAAMLILRLRALASEARALRAEIATIRARQTHRGEQPVPTKRARAPAAIAPVLEDPPPPEQEPQPNSAFESRRADPSAATTPLHPAFAEAPAPAPPLPNLGAVRRPAGSFGSGESQGVLPLQPDPATAMPPLPRDVLIRALQFPETEEDTEGFRALRRALRDHKAGQLIQAAQDVLTLLSQDGLYMDDLPPDRARPELWRRFCDGVRGGQIAELGGIRDRGALGVAGARLREDPVFRDAAHHFLRRFDRMLSETLPDASDQEVSDLADTRTARAFMLLGRLMGIFD